MSRSSSVSRRPAPWLACGLILAAATTAAPAQEELPCEGLLAADAARLAAVLGQVPKYGATYVLVYPDRLSDRIASLNSLAQEGLRVAVYDGGVGAELAAASPALASLDFAQAGAGVIVAEILAQERDAAVLWAPLAGLSILELDLDYELSMLTVGEPAPGPPYLPGAGPAGGIAGSEVTKPCANEVLVLLESYGVVPVEKLVPLDIRTLLLERPPRRSAAAAREGVELYTQNCAKCHGAEAVAVTDALAPVDLLVSTPRFSFPGFLYIVWNGREQKAMPGFRGTLSREQVEKIYQYARERSHGTLGVTGQYPVPELEETNALE